MGSLFDFLSKKLTYEHIKIFTIILFIFSLPFSETLKTITFVLLCLIFIFDLFKTKQFVYTPVVYGIIVYFIVGVIVSFFAIDKYTSFRGLIDIFKFSMVYIILINSFCGPRFRTVIEYSLIIFTTLGCLWGIIVWKLIYGKPALEIVSLGHQNHTSIFLGIVSIFLFCKLIWDNNLKKENYVFLLCCQLVVLLSLVLTLSRASILGLFCVLLFLCFYRLSRKMLFFLLFSLSIFFVFYFLSQAMHEKLFIVSSVESRLYIWEAGIKAFKDNLLFGVGLKNFGNIDASYYSIPIKKDHAHNVFIQVLTEMGLLGFFAFLFLLFSAFYYTKIAGYACLVFIIVNGIFNTTFRWEFAIAFMIIASLVDSPKQIFSLKKQ